MCRTCPRITGVDGDFGPPQTEIPRGKVQNPSPVSGGKKVFPARLLKVLAGDGALYLDSLSPAKRSLLHWQLTETAILEADRNPDRATIISHATDCFKNALETENNLEL
jgi:hypothetical protein